jgi:hypothetical protein
MQACATPPLDIEQGASPNFEEEADPTTILTTILVHVVMERCVTHENELWKGLEVTQGGLQAKAMAVIQGSTLPGQPRVRLDTKGGNDDLWRYIRGEHLTPILDRLAREPDVLWLVSDFRYSRPHGQNQENLTSPGINTGQYAYKTATPASR